MSAVLPLGLILIACVGIMYACNLFEQSSDYLGRNMGPGVKGATINAVGSSLPELFVALLMLFVFEDQGGFTGGIATTAGSAVFNAVVIPGAAILAVTAWMKMTKSIKIDRAVLIRDGIFVIAAELTLILFLGSSTLTWWMGTTLMGIYLLYFGYLMYQNSQHQAEEEEEDEEDVQMGNFFNDMFSAIRGNDISFTGTMQEEHDGRAWAYLGLAVTAVGGFCYLLSEAVIDLAHVWDVPLFITTVLLAAAATSVPDTIISIKDALKGEYEDAVANAIGSNIFDVCFSLGLPLTLYCLVVGPVTLQGGHEIQVLRWVMLAFTVGVLGMFAYGEVGKKTGIVMIGMYIGWVGYIACLAVF